MIYLASPYTGTLEVMQQRYEAVRHVTATLLVNRRWVYSPIVHAHEIAVRHSLPRDFQFWMSYNDSAIEHMSGVDVLQLPGWRESKGVQYEIGIVKMLKKPLHFISVNEESVAIHTHEERSGELICEFALI